MNKHLKRFVSIAMASTMVFGLVSTASAKTVTLQPSGYKLDVYKRQFQNMVPELLKLPVAA